MYILIGLLMFLVVILGILGFISTSKSYQKLKPEEEIRDSSGAEVNVQSSIIPTLEEKFFSANDELDKIKVEYFNNQEELEATKMRESGLREELLRQKQWYDKKAEELEKVKNDSAQLQEKLAIAEKQLEKEFTHDVTLNKEIKEKEEAIELLQKKNKEMADEIKQLKDRIEGQNKGN
jgi:chromosome segregation ATPase